MIIEFERELREYSDKLKNDFASEQITRKDNLAY